jgi:hypothetical protein
MSRKFSAVERRWGGSWGLIGPVADPPDTPDWWWDVLTKEAKQIIVEAGIKQRIETSKFAMARLKENVAMWEKVQATMKAKG